ncbi:MAG: CRISPR-associated endonuclease Cas1 [Chromatiaceae bacterium]|nr:CRISPR-associated endonuclease Cas1 [Chromatiaceae bacterium]
MSADLLLVIDHRETELTLDGRALRLATPGTAARHVPLGALGLVVVHGRPLVGCDVWRALSERRIPAVLLPGRGNGEAAWMGAALNAGVALRTAQHRAAEREDWRLAIARRLIADKLLAQGQATERLRLGEAADQVRGALRKRQRLALAQLPQCPTRAAIMGIEGASASAWFQWLALELGSTWSFRGRNRRPPRDPFNALLSLGYTLLGGDMLAAIQQQGLDPARGMLHDLVPGRESLVLDLIEPLRPSVDVVMLGLLDEVLKPGDFSYSPAEGCRLVKEARSRFYQAWAHARQDWPDLRPRDPNAETDAPEKQSLAQLCRREVERLRYRLRPLMPNVADDMPETD